MMMIGRSSAEERLAWFLSMLTTRSAGPDAKVLDLAMQRQDIADYLGLTIETVSRTFTLFRDRGFLKLPRKRRVEIVRPDALARLAAADRDATSRAARPKPRISLLRSPDARASPHQFRPESCRATSKSALSPDRRAREATRGNAETCDNGHAQAPKFSRIPDKFTRRPPRRQIMAEMRR